MAQLSKIEFLKNAGFKQNTIDFVLKCGIAESDLVWFVERIEKASFNIEDESAESKIRKADKLFKYDKSIKRDVSDIYEVIELADRLFEDDSNVEQRILHKFGGGNYILNLTSKELIVEGNLMRNCVAELHHEIEGKRKALLALKNRKGETLAHIEIKKDGTLGQHYKKANRPVGLKEWTYISKFFESNKDIKISEKLKENGFKCMYRIGSNNHNGFPIVEYYMPMRKEINFQDFTERYSDIRRIKDFVCTDQLRAGITQDSEDINKTIDSLSNKMNSNIEEMKKMMSKSDNNFFILNDEIIKKIFNFEYASIDEKMQMISSNSTSGRPMNIEYNDMMGGEQEIGFMDTPIRERIVREETVENVYLEADRPTISFDERDEYDEIEVEEDVMMKESEPMSSLDRPQPAMVEDEYGTINSSSY